MVANSSQPTFRLPDFVFRYPHPPTSHFNVDEIDKQSVEWLESNCPDLSAKGRCALRGLQAGNFVALCYNNATSDSRLRVVSDFMNSLFYFDNISDGMTTRETDVEVLSDVVMKALSSEKPAEELNSAGKLARDFWARFIVDAGPGVQKRFKDTFKLFFEAIQIQAKGRDAGIIPNLELYIDIRRNSSACKSCWALIEYALDIDLPKDVAEDPIIQELNRWTNDFVAWSNDIFSYNVEQAKGDTHNLIVVLINEGYNLQSAVDYVGNLCTQSIDGFNRDRERLPSWGPDIDPMVERYVEGLHNWIVSCLHWSFQTQRYFGTNGAEIKKTRLVRLLPRKVDSVDARDVHA